MANSLYSDIKGKGQDVVLLHGWGMHGGLWGDFKEVLSESFRLHVVDLPGFGFSHNHESQFNLDGISDLVESYIKKMFFTLKCC